MTSPTINYGIFAAHEMLPDGDWKEKAQAGQFAVKLDYEPLGPDTDRPVAGTFSAGAGVEKDFTGFTVEFINPDIAPPWRSGKVGLGKRGQFVTNLLVEQGKSNTFKIELRDSTGSLQKVTPSNVQLKCCISDPLVTSMSHSIGLARPNNEVCILVEKGSLLPYRARKSLHLGKDFSLPNPDCGLSIPVIEGDRRRADRNRMIGRLCIPRSKRWSHLPDGGEIEVTIEVDASRLIHTKAFIPILDEEFEDVLKLESPAPDTKQLSERLAYAKERLDILRERVVPEKNVRGEEAITRFNVECMIPEVEQLLSSAEYDSDAAQRCENVMLQLECALDEVEESLNWPALVAESERTIQVVRDLIENATSSHRNEFVVLEREIREAIQHRIPDLLLRRLDFLNLLASVIGLHRFALTNQRILPDGVTQIEARLTSPTGKLARGIAVELVNEDLEPERSSGGIPVGPSGIFEASVSLNTQRRTNEFRVALRDRKSQPLRISPNYFVLSVPEPFSDSMQICDKNRLVVIKAASSAPAGNESIT